MPKLAIVKLPTNATYRGWTYVLIIGIVLAVVALIDRGSVATVAATGETGCQLTVSAERVNVRGGPDESADLVGTLTQGTLLDATRTVTGDFRELADGRWVADRFLTPVPGTTCS